MLGEDRLVLPIPPGKHWADEMPVLLPADPQDAPKQITDGKARAARRPAKTRVPQAPQSRRLTFAPVVTPAAREPAKAGPKVREKKPKRKNDPKLVAAARELRDRWLERVNAGEYVLEADGKYDVTRALPDRPAAGVALLPAA
jgi:hypothetical protein